ncbi:MAG: hypothetical protein ACTH8J_03470, partial [Specibacter sp.]
SNFRASRFKHSNRVSKSRRKTGGHPASDAARTVTPAAPERKTARNGGWKSNANRVFSGNCCGLFA